MVQDEDLQFVRNMLLDHAQALEMTRLVPQRTSRDDVPLFAERIELSQADEIELMQNWLRERGEPVFDLDSPDAAHGHDAQRVGMLTPEQMGQLAAATDEEFDELFLQCMYIHHQGAFAMVEELLAADGAQDSFVFQLSGPLPSGAERVVRRCIVEPFGHARSPSPRATGLGFTPGHLHRCRDSCRYRGLQT